MDDENPLPPQTGVPLDIQEEIFAKCCVKTLCRLRCGSSYWNSLFSDVNFCRKQLQLARLGSASRFHLFIAEGKPPRFWTSPISKLLNDATGEIDLPLQKLPNVPWKVVPDECCNGMFLYYYPYKESVVIWNPSVDKFKMINLSNDGAVECEKAKLMRMQSGNYSYKIAFGYDPCVMDFFLYIVHVVLGGDSEVSAFHLGQGTREILGPFPFAGEFATSMGIFVKDTINWFIHRSLRLYAISYDLRIKSYQEFALPAVIPNLHGLYNLNDRLSFVSYPDDKHHYNIWSLDREGGFWENLYTINFSDLAIMKTPLCMRGDELLTLVTSEKGDELVTYNVKNSKSLRVLLRHKIDGAINMVKVYHESLVCPFGSVNVGGGNGKNAENAKVREDAKWMKPDFNLELEKVYTNSDSSSDFEWDLDSDDLDLEFVPSKKAENAVDVASGLQDSGHILEDGKSIYNTTMNMFDQDTSDSRYYILQIIEEDEGSDCYLFQKWGQFGNNKSVKTCQKKLSKSAAIREFKQLFIQKTGKSWEAWEQRTVQFQAQPGRYFPLECQGI